MENNNDGVEREKNRVYYDSAAKYWSQIPATIEGMLGGFGFISRTDIKGSHSFLKHLFMMSNPPGRDHAADCGAGIGRITKNLLSKYFANVDLVEQDPKFLDEAKSFIRAKQTTVNCINVGLQDFAPELETYDVIWSQWVLGHLTDEDLVAFFKACKRGLKSNGLIVVKENITSSGKVEVDYEDSSVTRPLHLFKELYMQAGLTCFYQKQQTNFPKGIYQVIMFALRPDQQSNHLNLNSSINCSVNTRDPDEEITHISISTEYNEIKENHLNLNSMDFAVVENMQEVCNSSSVVPETPHCTLPLESTVTQENLSSAACTLKAEMLSQTDFEDIPPENEKTNCLMLSEVENMYRYNDCCVVNEESEGMQHDNVQQCFTNQLSEAQQESQTMPLEDLQLDCTSRSSAVVNATVPAEQYCRNFPLQSGTQEYHMLPTDDTQQHRKDFLSADLQQASHALSPEDTQQKSLGLEFIPQESHMMSLEVIQQDNNPTNLLLGNEKLIQPET